MPDNILFVDDEPNVVLAFKVSLKGRFHVETATSGCAGLDVLAEKGPFAVIVADMRMPGMDGIELLKTVRQRAPDTVRMVLTGNADLTSAIGAVNDGFIFRFLTKPCPKDVLIRAIESGVRQYKLVTAERELLVKTLSGSVKVLTDMLSMVNPAAFSRAGRVRRHVKHVAMKLGLRQVWQFEIAAMLSQVGCVTLPAQMLGRAYAGKKLTPHEQKMFASHPEAGSNLIAAIPRLEKVAAIIARQQEPFGSQGSAQEGATSDTAAVGGHILKVVLDFDGRLEGGRLVTDVIDQLRRQPDMYDPEIVEALIGLDSNSQDSVPRTVSIAELEPAMVINQNVYTKDERYVVMKGQVVTDTILELLRGYAQTVGIEEPIHVLAPSAGHSLQAETVPTPPGQPGDEQQQASRKVA